MKKTIELSTKRKVDIKEMSIDDIDMVNDLTTIHSDSGGGTYFSGLAKARTAWLRRGIKGGEFNSFKLNSEGFVDDSVLKQLSENEKNELIPLLQRYQNMGEEKPSH